MKRGLCELADITDVICVAEYQPRLRHAAKEPCDCIAQARHCDQLVLVLTGTADFTIQCDLQRP